MTLNRVRLQRAVTFLKHLASIVSLIFLTKTLVLNKNQVFRIKFTESCRVGGK